MKKFITINIGAGASLVVDNMKKSHKIIDLINNDNYIGYIFKDTLRLSSTHIKDNIKYLTYDLKR